MVMLVMVVPVVSVLAAAGLVFGLWLDFVVDQRDCNVVHHFVFITAAGRVVA